MAIYKNIKTGAEITTDCELKGNWELVETKKVDNVPTADELKSLLTELGVEFNPKAKKAELLELYEANKVD